MERRVRDVDAQMIQVRATRPATRLLWSLHSLCSYSNFSL
jgi:hypothetical protein